MNKFLPVIEQYRVMQQSVRPAYMEGTSSQVVIIDMGHGGLSMDNKTYATAPSKMAVHPDFTFWEGAWTRAIGYTFASKLREAGRNYVIISNDQDISLTKRVQLTQFASHQMPDHNFYVCCIHANAFGQENANGVEVFTSPGETKSDPIATVYYNKLERLGWKMRPALGDGDPDKEARFTMLTGPEQYGIPSILPEIGFYTNYDQAVEMCKPETMEFIVELMLEADTRVDYDNLLR